MPGSDPLPNTATFESFFMFSFHRLDYGFNEHLLGFGDAVFGVELGVDFRNRARPVDVGGRGEVLERDKGVHIAGCMLRRLAKRNKKSHESCAQIVRKVSCL